MARPKTSPNTQKRAKLTPLFQQAITHVQAGRLDDAEPLLRQVLEIEPNQPTSLQILGVIHHKRGQNDAAVQLLSRACALDPTSSYYVRSLAVVLQDRGDIEGAVKCFDTSLSLQLDAMLFSHMLLCMHYRMAWSRQQLFDAHRRYNEQYCKPLAASRSSFANTKEPDRKIRVGYVSNDFATHIGSYFLLPVFSGTDRERFETHVYHVDMLGGMRVDHFTEQLRSHATHWHTLPVIGDEELARLIRDDGIDILVDLCGHAGSNRLQVFARKPAPVQVTWLGYPDTTGVDAIDYRLVDNITDPLGDADRYCGEKLVRLGGGFLPFAPHEDAPDVAPPPFQTEGVITFGSFNRPEKVPDELLEAWVEITRRVPNSRLMLKSRFFNIQENITVWTGRLAALGLPAERQILLGHTPEHLVHYGRVDLCLDTYPYNGTITTLDALWMGVPVVTWGGDRHVSRVGASLLTHVGLGALVAKDRDDYVRIAVTLASNPAVLAGLRNESRARLLSSPLCKSNRFVRALEVAYRAMWARWCQDLPPESLFIAAVQDPA